MTTFNLADPVVPDDRTQRNNDALIAAVNAIAQFIDYGNGAPAHTPTGPRIYFNRTGGVGTSFYAWTSAAWVALA